LRGVNTIIVWASDSFDRKNEGADDLPDVRLDFDNLDRAASDELTGLLDEAVKQRVQVKWIRSADLTFRNIYGKHSHVYNEQTLIVRLTFGFGAAQMQERPIFLGAVYPTLERVLPKPLSADRASGFNGLITGRIRPVPFLMSGNAAENQQAALKAADESLKDLAAWLNGGFDSLPKRGNN